MISNKQGLDELTRTIVSDVDDGDFLCKSRRVCVCVYVLSVTEIFRFYF